MRSPIHTIVETAAFAAQAARLGVTAAERHAILDIYAANPDHGVVVKRTGGLRKGRVAKEGTGKSGGYRVFSFFADRDNPVFLLWVIDKTKDETLTDAQEKVFKKLTASLKKECR